MSGADPLFDVKNAYYLGNWQQCLNEAQKVKLSDEDKQLERDVFMYRAYIGQKKYNVVMTEINDSSDQQLKSVRLFAQYLSQPDDREKIIEDIDSKQSLFMADSISSICAASIYFLERNYEMALKMLNNSNNIECMAASVQALLMLDRLDLARKEYKKMCQTDEYHTLSQLCLAWINIYQNGEKLQDAYFIYQELKDKFGPTPLLLNSQATVLISQNRLEEAESLINECIGKNPNYTEAIVNQMVMANMQGKSTDILNRFINQLNDPGLDPSFYESFESKQNEFDRLAKEYLMAV